jgi:hypothetical protein
VRGLGECRIFDCLVVFIFALHVGTGERIVGPAVTLFLDEISTGLDSSTTFLIVRCIRNFCHMQQVGYFFMLGG